MFQRVTNLFRNLAIYGVGDVAVSLVSLLLLPVYTRYLSPSDYGVIAMLLTVEAVAKVVFRWGVDTAFMRLYYDCRSERDRQRLASTIFLFLLAVNGALVAGAIASAGWLSVLLFGTVAHALLVTLVIVNTFVAGFYFIPFQVLRIGERSGQFIALVFGRSAGTLVVRLLLVIWAGMGVFGVVLADIVVTAVFTIVLGRWFAPLIRPMFSREVIREALGFGLPRIPHSIAHQIMALADRYFLNAYATLRDVGVYSIGASFGLALKLFLGAFESAWTPFFLGVMREPDAERIYSSVSTYVMAVLVLLTSGLCAVARDLIRLATTPAFHDAAAVTPWIAVGVMFQGIYLVGSIGIIITKRTTRYPLATGLAAATSLTANALLIRTYGLMGAAWSNALSYGTLALFTVWFSYRLYPIRYEWGRLLRIAVAGIVAYIGAMRFVAPDVHPAVGVILRGVLVIVIYAVALAATGFLRAGEWHALKDIRRRVVERRPAARVGEPYSTETEMAGEIVASAPEPDVTIGNSRDSRR